MRRRLFAHNRLFTSLIFRAERKTHDSLYIDSENQTLRSLLEKPNENGAQLIRDLQLLQIPLQNGILPNYFIGCRSIEDFHNSVSLFDDLKSSGYKAERFDYQTLLRNSVKWKNTEKITLSLIDEMMNEGIQMNSRIHRYMMIALCQAGKIDEAIHEIFTNDSWNIDYDSYISVLQACVDTNRTEAAEKIDELLRERGWTERTQSVYNALFKLYENTKKYKKYIELHKEYLEAQLQPTVNILNGLLNSLIQMREFNRCFEILGELNITSPIVSSIMMNIQTFILVGELCEKTKNAKLAISSLSLLSEANWGIPKSDKIIGYESIINNIGNMKLTPNELRDLISRFHKSLKHASEIDLIGKIIHQYSDSDIEGLFHSFKANGQLQVKILDAIMPHRIDLFRKLVQQQITSKSNSIVTSECMIKHLLAQKDVKSARKLMRPGNNLQSRISELYGEYINVCAKEKNLEAMTELMFSKPFPPLTQQLLDSLVNACSANEETRASLIEFIRTTKRGTLFGLNLSNLLIMLLNKSIPQCNYLLELLIAGGTSLSILERVSVQLYCNNSNFENMDNNMMDEFEKFEKLIDKATDTSPLSSNTFPPSSGKITEPIFLEIIDFLCEKSLFLESTYWVVDYLLHYKCYEQVFDIIVKEKKGFFSYVFLPIVFEKAPSQALLLFEKIPLQPESNFGDRRSPFALEFDLLKSILVHSLYDIKTRENPPNLSKLINYVIEQGNTLPAYLYYTILLNTKHHNEVDLGVKIYSEIKKKGITPTTDMLRIVENFLQQQGKDTSSIRNEIKESTLNRLLKSNQNSNTQTA